MGNGSKVVVDRYAPTQSAGDTIILSFFSFAAKEREENYFNLFLILKENVFSYNIRHLHSHHGNAVASLAMNHCIALIFMK